LKRFAEALPGVLRRRLRSKTTRERQIQRRLTPEQIERLVAEHLAGNSVQKLANSWHLHQTTVTEHLRRAGVPVRQRSIPDDNSTKLSASTPMGGHVAALLSTTAVTTKQHAKHSDAQELSFAGRGTLTLCM
jgi:hypothetical protein